MPPQLACLWLVLSIISTVLNTSGKCNFRTARHGAFHKRCPAAASKHLNTAIIFSILLFLFRLIVCVSHSTSSAFSLQGRNIRFLRTAFNTIGEAFAAGDHQGNIFVFDLAKNR